jgi:hypothetical protein
MKRNNFSYFEKIMHWPQEKLHIIFGRYILGVNNKTTQIAILSELGRYPFFLLSAEPGHACPNFFKTKIAQTDLHNSKLISY